VLRAVAAGAKVAYVDNDPKVGVLASELLTDDGTTAVIVADLRDPDAVLGNARVRALIDFGEPAGLLMTAVLQFVADEDDPWGLVGRYLAALCPGSYLALSHITRDKLPPRLVQTGVADLPASQRERVPRTLPEIERFFTGLEVVPPYEGAGPVLANVGLWEDPASADTDGSRAFYCGVARRP
jgi:hypothetical protein